MPYLSIGEFAEAIGKTTQTVRNWDNSGYLKPAKIGLGGHRYYTQEQVDNYLGKDKYIEKLIIKDEKTLKIITLRKDEMSDDLCEVLEYIIHKYGTEEVIKCI